MSGPVLHSVFLAVLYHSALVRLSSQGFIDKLSRPESKANSVFFPPPSLGMEEKLAQRSNSIILARDVLFFLFRSAMVQNRHESRCKDCTMVENGKKHRQNSHLIIHFPTSEGVSEGSERANE